MGETAKRILSAAFLVGFVIAALYWQKEAHALLPLLLIMLFAVGAVYEFYHLTDRGLEGRAVRLVGYVATAGIILSFYAEAMIGSGQGGEIQALLRYLYPGQSLLGFWLLFAAMGALIGHLLFRPLDGTIYGSGVTLAGVLYAALPLAHAFPLLFQAGGTFYLLLVAAITFMTDTGAYFAGRWFGRHNAGFKVSPRKTIEGYVGGYIIGAISALGFFYGFQSQAGAASTGLFQSAVEIVLFSLVFSTLAIFGDLSESALKRDARVKDSASIIPGHGGVLDLIDALLFTLPAAYYYLHFKAVIF
ncbi:MAG: phosphatidate cytidylyltransferase [Spirochaetales bacterium]|nr:phosphatidate cytidylyltransferase [Spirochaetales bacterium]